MERPALCIRSRICACKAACEQLPCDGEDAHGRSGIAEHAHIGKVGGDDGEQGKKERADEEDDRKGSDRRAVFAAVFRLDALSGGRRGSRVPFFCGSGRFGHLFRLGKIVLLRLLLAHHTRREEGDDAHRGDEPYAVRADGERRKERAQDDGGSALEVCRLHALCIEFMAEIDGSHKEEHAEHEGRPQMPCREESGGKRVQNGEDKARAFALCKVSYEEIPQNEHAEGGKEGEKPEAEGAHAEDERAEGEDVRSQRVIDGICKIGIALHIRTARAHLPYGHQGVSFLFRIAVEGRGRERGKMLAVEDGGSALERLLLALPFRTADDGGIVELGVHQNGLALLFGKVVILRDEHHFVDAHAVAAREEAVIGIVMQAPAVFGDLGDVEHQPVADAVGEPRLVAAALGIDGRHGQRIGEVIDEIGRAAAADAQLRLPARGGVHGARVDEHLLDIEVVFVHILTEPFGKGEVEHEGGLLFIPVLLCGEDEGIARGHHAAQSPQPDDEERER